MNTIGERIKYLRKVKLDKTQQEFGEIIGLKPNSVSDIENGKNNPTDQTIKAICREFSIREDWLRSEEGEPEIKKGRNQEILDYANEIMDLPNDNLQRRLIEALMKLDSDDWKAIEKIADKLLKEG